jgi:hypothetical protein
MRQHGARFGGDGEQRFGSAELQARAALYSHRIHAIVRAQINHRATVALPAKK